MPPWIGLVVYEQASKEGVMNDTAVKPNDLCDGLNEKLKALGRRAATGFKAWQHNRDQAALESALARIIETANSHKEKGNPDGSAIYLELRNMAYSKIEQFCAKHNVDRLSIETQVPALSDLNSYCIAKKKTPQLAKLFAVLFGGVVALLLIGIASGLVSVGHHWVMQLLGR